MRTNIFAALVGMGLAIVTAGCVNTVSDTQTPGVYSPDKTASRYQRPFDDVYNAAVQVVTHDGVLIAEGTRHDTTNQVRSVEGKVNGEKVYIEVEAVDPQLTQVTVQARTSMVGDRQLASEVNTEIALQLSRE